MWVKPLLRGDWAVCFLNRTDKAQTLEVNWPDYVVDDDISKQKLDPVASTFSIRDLWKHQALGTTKQPLRATVPSKDVVMVRLRPANSGANSGF